MNKNAFPLISALLILGCTACSGPKEVIDKEYTININGENLTGVFSGTIDNKVPNGNGSFSFSDDDTVITYSGIWENGTISDNGYLDYQGMNIDYNDATYVGNYSGEAIDGKPNGLGQFISTDGINELEYSGNWENGDIVGNGKLSINSIEISYCGNNYIGSFSGEVMNGIPHGNGVFDSTFDNINLKYDGCWENGVFTENGHLDFNDFELGFQQNSYRGSFSGDVKDGSPNGSGSFVAMLETGYFNYNGEWKNGAPFGNGTLEDSNYIVTFPDGIIRLGEYKGNVVNGQASGTGTYTTKNDEGTTYTHEGMWENGVPNGHGRRTLQLPEPIILEGNYVDGEFTPTPLEYFITEGTVTEQANYTIIEQANEFIKNNPNIFLTNDISTYTGEIDSQFQHKAFAKNQTQYGDKLIVVPGLQVVQIMEDHYWGSDHTFCILQDSNYDVYYVNMYGFANDIYEGSWVTLTALPLDYFTYPSVSGSEVWAIACAGVKIE